MYMYVQVQGTCIFMEIASHIQDIASEIEWMYGKIDIIMYTGVQMASMTRVGYLWRSTQYFQTLWVQVQAQKGIKPLCLISSYGAQVFQRASYLMSHSSLFGPDDRVNSDYYDDSYVHMYIHVYNIM